MKTKIRKKITSKIKSKSRIHSAGSGLSYSRVEFRLISPMSIRTTRCRISLPGRICSTVNFPFATRVSSPAAHSKAEPWAMSKKRQGSLGAYLPLPSAMFSGTLSAARRELTDQLHARRHPLEVFR